MADETFIPEEPEAIEPLPIPEHREKINNLAGDKNLADKFWSFTSQRCEYYRNQPERVKFTKTGGTMDTADRMEGCALRRNESSAQHQDTLSDVTSILFHKNVRTITANENLIFFQNSELPAMYTPEITTDRNIYEESKHITDQRNMLEEYTFDEDKRIPKIKSSIYFTNKYANEVVSIVWDRRIEKRRRRIVTEKDADGRPTKYDFEDVKEVIADWPTFRRHDMKDCFFDAQIDDMDAQRLFAVRFQEPYEKLIQMQLADEIKNVEKIRPKHLYMGDGVGGEDTVATDRQTNADTGASSEANGLVDVWEVFGFVPISENMGKHGATGNGKWDAKKNVAVRYHALYAGHMGDKDAICLKLCKNERHTGKTGYKLIHSHDDDIGAFHRGYAFRCESLYWQDVTVMNQAIDNTTLRTKIPFSCDGPIHTRLDKAWRGNMVIELGKGTNLKPIEVPEATQITMAMRGYIKDEIADLFGANNPVVGEVAFARTAATEARQNLEQALAPIEHKAAYEGEQLFVWMLETDAELWEQYGDPDTIIAVTKNDMIEEIKPAELYGPIRVKVTAINKFRNDTVRRQTLNNFIQNAAGVFLPVMGETGLSELGRQATEINGLENPNALFPVDTEYDAKMRAIHENEQIISGNALEAQPGENHTVHIPKHKQARREYELLPEGDRDPNVLAAFDNMIAQHEGYAQEKMARMQTAQQAAQPTETGLPGEVIGDRMEAIGGANA